MDADELSSAAWAFLTNGQAPLKTSRAGVGPSPAAGARAASLLKNTSKVMSVFSPLRVAIRRSASTRLSPMVICWVPPNCTLMRYGAPNRRSGAGAAGLGLAHAADSRDKRARPWSRPGCSTRFAAVLGFARRRSFLLVEGGLLVGLPLAVGVLFFEFQGAEFGVGGGAGVFHDGEAGD